jgi:LPXTG-motif cell wall-anchored protein
MLALHALSTGAFASNAVAVPEINPGSISAGLALLAGGVLMLRARRRK